MCKHSQQGSHFEKTSETLVSRSSCMSTNWLWQYSVIFTAFFHIIVCVRVCRHLISYLDLFSTLKRSLVWGYRLQQAQ